MKKIIIINGFFGKGNCGDEAILQTWYDRLSDKFRIIASVDPDIVNCNKECKSYELYKNIDIIQNRRVDIFCNDIVDSYIIGGGGLGLGFGVEQWLHSVLRNKKKFYLGTIVHEEFSSGNKDLIEINKNFFKSFDMISVRDKVSKYNLKNIFGVESYQYPDIAFGLEPEIIEIKSEKKYVTVTIRDNGVNDIDSISNWLNKIKEYANSLDYDIIYLPFDKTDERLFGQLGLDLKYDNIYWYPKKVKYLISKSEMVFSLGRYHPLVFGISSGITSYYINCQPNDAQWRYTEENKDKSFNLLKDYDILDYYLTNFDFDSLFKKNENIVNISSKTKIEIDEFFDVLIKKLEV